MRNYEIAIIIHPDADSAALISKVDEWIARAGGVVVRTDHWGKRKLAYKIAKQAEGFYAFWYVQLPMTAPAEIERSLRLTETVVRFMIIHLESIAPAKPVDVPAEPVAESIVEPVTEPVAEPIAEPVAEPESGEVNTDEAV